MNSYVIRLGIALMLSPLTGCTGFFHDSSPPVSSIVQQASSVDEPGELTADWRQDAEVLRAFADRHEAEAELLLRDRSPEDVGLIQQRRALARQLRLAAGQVEQRAEETRSQVTMEWSSDM